MTLSLSLVRTPEPHEEHARTHAHTRTTETDFVVRVKVAPKTNRRFPTKEGKSSVSF
jgi:hypothetical protein